MELTITIKFKNYQEHVIRRCTNMLSVNIYSEDFLSLDANPFRTIYKQTIHEIPTQSKHTIKFSKNRKEPIIDGYVLKVEKPSSYTEEVESYFEIAGMYLDETILENTFGSVPNDLVDYENNPTGEEPEYEDYTNLTRLRYD